MLRTRVRGLVLLSAIAIIVLSGCNQQKAERKKLTTFYCDYINAIVPAVEAMQAFEKGAKEDVSYLRENIFEMPKGERERRINNILAGNEIFLITLNSSISKLAKIDTIADTAQLKQETLLTFYITEDFLSTDFKKVCVTLRDSLEVLPSDYFDKDSYFSRQKDKLEHITMRNNAVGDLQTKFFEAHGLAEEDVNELFSKCSKPSD